MCESFARRTRVVGDLGGVVVGRGRGSASVLAIHGLYGYMPPVEPRRLAPHSRRRTRTADDHAEDHGPTSEVHGEAMTEAVRRWNEVGSARMTLGDGDGHCRGRRSQDERRTCAGGDGQD